MATGDPRKIQAGPLNSDRQDEIRARIQRTLDASRMTAPSVSRSDGAGADQQAAGAALEGRRDELERELQAARARITELEANLEEARAAHATLARDKAVVD